jgi:hypothetical protein
MLCSQFSAILLRKYWRFSKNIVMIQFFSSKNIVMNQFLQTLIHNIGFKKNANIFAKKFG